MNEMLRNTLAVLMGNIKCFLIKFTSIGNEFCYKVKIRIFPRVRISVRNGGSCRLGNNLKIDSDALIASNGGCLEIDENVGIGKGNIIVCQDNIKIGEGTILGPNVFIYDHDHSFSTEIGINRTEYKTAPVYIGKNVWIGANTVILRGTYIGDNCVVGAGCVLKGNFQDGKRITQKRLTNIN